MHISPLLVLVTIELEQKERRTCSHSHFRRSVVLSEHVFLIRLQREYVIGGGRPDSEGQDKLLDHFPTRAVLLMKQCWEFNPSIRPSGFDEIQARLKEIVADERTRLAAELTMEQGTANPVRQELLKKQPVAGAESNSSSATLPAQQAKQGAKGKGQERVHSIPQSVEFDFPAVDEPVMVTNPMGRHTQGMKSRSTQLFRPESVAEL
jgi:hypothetical protein